MDYAKYLSIPYVFNAEGFDGSDCYGLVCLYFMEELGIEILRLKKLITDGDYRVKTSEIENYCDDWIAVTTDEARVNDVVLCSRGRGMWHLGVIVSDGVMMHTTRYKGVTTIKLSRMRGIHGTYRHRSLYDCQSNSEHIRAQEQT